jgi:uncharacterized protein (TIGR02466 family)
LECKIGNTYIMKPPVMEDSPTMVELPNPSQPKGTFTGKPPTAQFGVGDRVKPHTTVSAVVEPEPEHGYAPAAGEILSLFSTPFLRGVIDLDTEVIAQDCRLLCDQVAERTGYNPQHEYTTYFDDDIRTSMHDMGWFKDFSNIIKDSYVTFVTNMFQHPVSHLERDDIHLFAWVSRYTGPHQHEAHNHVNCLISGTYYIKNTDEVTQPIKFWSPNHGVISNHQSVERPQERDNMPNMVFDGVHGSDSTMSYYPQEGQFLLWPSYILHSVPPVMGDVPEDYERISISFNLKHRVETDSNTTGDNMSYSFFEEEVTNEGEAHVK